MFSVLLDTDPADDNHARRLNGSRTPGLAYEGYRKTT